MNEPDFAVGDEVECEAAPDGLTPRWNGNTDNGKSGQWIRGTVVAVTDREVEVNFSTTRWYWAIGGRAYTGQWSWPGQLRLYRQRKSTANKSKYSLFSGYFKDLLDDGYFPEYDHLRSVKRRA